MEVLFGLLFLGIFIFAAVNSSRRTETRDEKNVQAKRRAPQALPQKPTTNAPVRPSRPRADMPLIEGPAYVVDGDSLVIKKNQIRLYGVDAPELNHPFGQKAKWAMVSLCKGQKIRAKIIEQDVHGRAVALCYLPGGRDLSEEIVKLGLALDWPKYSEGDYRMFEPEGVRKKLWLADARQKGRMHVWAQFDARQKARAKDQVK